MTERQLEQLADAKSFLVDKLGCGPEIRVVFDYIHQLETQVAELQRQNSDLSWSVYPDRMGN